MVNNCVPKYNAGKTDKFKVSRSTQIFAIMRNIAK